MRPPLPAAAQPVDILSVPYRHLALPDGSDLYLTPHGVPFWEFLLPECWYEKQWFSASRTKLQGTSLVYRVATKPVRGEQKDLVVKWCRVGETVPVDTFTLQKFIEAEFNTPYEEFSLLSEMRAHAGHVLTQKPLAIFVPAKRFQLWQTGRKRSKIEQKKAKFRDVELDISRQYIMIYEWIKGAAVTEPPAREAAARAGLDPEMFSRDMLTRALTELWQVGFRVLDIKPQHLIVRPRPEGGFLADARGRTAYAMVDFELLTRTPDYEERVTRLRRRSYLVRQRDRFSAGNALPEHLDRREILGVAYIHGPCESTNGQLWVVGRDPQLFDYFQPERWRRTPSTSLSETARVCHTRTKDGIELVWKVAHLGEKPEDPAAAENGYNSPFEEFAYAMRLSAAGVGTTYPRAIYMLGHDSTLPGDALDPRHYEAMSGLLNDDGKPLLRRDRNYIAIWGYWNGPDEELARDDTAGKRAFGRNGDQALADGAIDRATYDRLMAKYAALLAGAGLECACPKGTHFLLTVRPDGKFARDPDGLPALRICNFEFVRPVRSAAP